MPFTFRPDGDYVKHIDHNRRIMPYIMRTKMESTVYFKQTIPARKTWEFLQEYHLKTGIKATIMHLVIWAVEQVILERPQLNRFIAGRRIYQRRGFFVSFSAKKELNDQGPVVAIKKEVHPEWDFQTLVQNLSRTISMGKSSQPSHTDKELSLLFRLPGFLLSCFSMLLMKLDQFGWVPGFFIHNDPLYASVFIANLGSINLDSAYHHLFEYGNIPIFITIGKYKKYPVVTRNNKVDVQPVIQLKFTFDERIADGFYCLRAVKRLEEIIADPYKFLTID